MRINVFGESAFQLPVAEFEFVGVGAMLLSSLPTPVQPQQVLGRLSSSDIFFFFFLANYSL